LLIAIFFLSGLSRLSAADPAYFNGYPDPIPQDVSYDTVVGSQSLPTIKYPVTVIGAAYHPEEVHVTPSGELMLPYTETFTGLCVAPLVGAQASAEGIRPIPLSLPPVEADKWRLVEGYMPGVENQWTFGDIELRQLAFATAGGGFLSTTGREPLVTLVRYTLTNKSSSPRNAALAIGFGQAFAGLSMKAVPPIYPQRLSYDAPLIRRQDGAVVARLIRKDASPSFKPLGSVPDADPAHYCVLNGKGESIKGPDFTFEVERSGDAVAIGGWQAPAGADVYIEAPATHTLGMAVNMKVVDPQGKEKTIGTIHRSHFLTEKSGAQICYIAPGRHSARMPWSELAKRLPQGKSKLVAHCRLPDDAPVKTVGSWEPIFVCARAGAVPKFKYPGDRYTDENRLNFTFSLEPGQSKTVDLAIPYFPLAGDAANVLAGLNVDDTLAAFRKFWSERLNGKARFIVPETRIRNAYRACLAYDMILTDRNPRTGVLMPHPDATAYECVWGGDGSVAMQAIDRMGFHQDVEAMINHFLGRQGVGKPEGDVTSAEGYLSGESIAWMNENGFILWAMGEHYKLSHDDAWLRRVAPRMIEACRWTIRERARTKVMENGRKVRHYGLLPKGRPSDLWIWDNWYWTDTYSYMGLRWTADVLPAVGMKDEAAKLAAEADDYKACILDSIARSIDPKIKPPFIPPTPYRNATPPGKAFFDEVWYAVSNPIYMVEAGLLDARDEKIAGTAYWLEKYGMITGLPVFGAGGIDPHYVYNHALAQLLRGERAKFAWTLYSLGAYGQAQGTYATIEGHDIIPGFRAEGWDTNRQPHMHSCSRFIDMVRIALLLEEGDTLHLLAGAPRGWLADGQTVEVKNSPSYFGEVNYAARSDVAAGQIAVAIQPTPWKAPKVVIHVRPPAKYGKLKSVRVNGKEWKDFDRNSVTLPRLDKKTNVVCTF
jgi:hypothetical protein